MENAVQFEQESYGLHMLERIVSNFLGAGLATLAIYLFASNTQELWSLLIRFDYDPDLADLGAIAVSVVVGLVLTVLLESEKARSVDSEKLHYWLEATVRYFLAYIFLSYGFAKVFHNQFYSFSSALDTPLGEITGLTLTWRFFGYSYAYTLFVASSQIVGSILLFNRRTTTLGAAILLPVISNIVFVNFTHSIPVRLYSTIYLVMVVNGVSRAADADRSVWRKVYFESDRFVSIKTGEPKPEVFISRLDSQNQTIKLQNRKNYDPSVEGSYDFEGSYELLSERQLIITASNGVDTIHVTLNRPSK